MNCLRMICIGTHAAVIESNTSPKEQDRNRRCLVKLERSPKKRCQILKQILLTITKVWRQVQWGLCSANDYHGSFLVSNVNVKPTVFETAFER